MSKTLGVNQIRQMFLDYFEKQGHLILPSFSLVPHNDKSLLLINAGMAPLKPYFTGQEIPPRTRVATCQKCIRTGDIENVGKTARHGTFFEMLGNFSFGDYFKRESIRFTWEFLTDVMGLAPDRLYPSVYEEDDEAFEIWNKEIGIAADRIYRFGKADNFWEHGSGPCGPCSEVYYDRGEKYGKDEYVGSEGDRFIEVWNNVFTQFESDGKGNYTELANKNIDTGMGLERLAVVVQDVGSIFEIDTISALLYEVARIAGVSYKEDEQKDISLRLITDHIRSCTFMISDGIMPSNEGRGYVLRRLLRRAARHGKMLGIKHTFLAELATTVIELSKDGYPELNDRREMILKVLTEEENKFYKNIEQGLTILNEIEEKLLAAGMKVMSEEDAFKLYDTYGFPLDLTKEIVAEKGITINEEGFHRAMKAQREAARAARKTTNYMGADVTVYQSLDASLKSNFNGYDRLEDVGTVIALTNETEIVQALTEGDHGTILVDTTPFYATMGGQSADIGVIESMHGTFVVEDTIALQGDKIGHVGYMKEGLLRMDETVTLKVDAKNRRDTARNHSCTHLLHKALKLVLGNHVEQAGSLVSADRLRFDFTHFAALTQEELAKVEQIVKDEIAKDHPVRIDVMNIEEAKKSGATALFGEKYGEHVRVVSMEDFSKELCGGTHVASTGEIKLFKIVSEAGIAAGVRRIEALTADGLIAYYENLERNFVDVAKELKSNTVDAIERVRSLQEEVKSLKSENEKLKAKLANNALGESARECVDVEGISLVTMKVEGIEINELRNLGDKLRVESKEGVVVLASVVDQKVTLLVMAGSAAQAKGAHAGNIVKAIAGHIGGGGGGRPNMAQAGGSNMAGIETAFASAKTVLASQLA